MAASVQTPQSAQPPPDVPFDPKISEALTQYLRTFSLWCRKGFQDRLPSNTALPSLLLQAYDPAGNILPAVYKVTVVVTAGTPALVLAPVGIGGDLRQRSVGSGP